MVWIPTVSAEAAAPHRGEVWWIDLDPVRGHEQGRRRPGLVVSVDEFNKLAHGLTWVVPITTRLQRHSFAVAISPPDGGLSKPSVALCHQLRTVSIDPLDQLMGRVSTETLDEVCRRVGLILGEA
jgi:mRNA interferase MazF